MDRARTGESVSWMAQIGVVAETFRHRTET